MEALDPSREGKKAMRMLDSKGIVALVTGALLTLAGATGAAAQGMTAVDAVIGNNFGHLPMFVGVDKGFFKKHGVDVRLKVVSTGSEMVSAMQKREVQIGDMSVTTFLKARHAGDPFRVIALIMNDATRANAVSRSPSWRGRTQASGRVA